MKKVVEVIVLDLKSYSESSVWVCFFSKEKGLQNGIIKGGKKKRTKASILGIFYFTLYKPTSEGLQSIINLERGLPLGQTYLSPQKVLIAFFMADSYKSILVNCGVDTSFYELVKNQITKLNSIEKPGSVPVFYLARLIEFLGYRPLNPTHLALSFDPINGAFNPEAPSLKTIKAPEVVNEIHFVFNNKAGELLYPKETFDVLVNYANQHIPGYNLNKSIEVIRDVLYG